MFGEGAARRCLFDDCSRSVLTLKVPAPGSVSLPPQDPPQSRMNLPFHVAGRHDAVHLGTLLGEAFANDPVARWTLGDPRAIAATYVAFARRVYVPLGASHVSPGRGGAMWLPPGVHAGTDIMASLAVGAALTRFSGVSHIRRALLLDDAMRRHHPTEPHYYLFLVGVVPPARGQGLASALLRETLAQADARGVPCYLENSNPANRRLYERLGFVGSTPFTAGSDCPPLVPMWREPRDREMAE